MGALIATVIIVIFTSLLAWFCEETKTGQAITDKCVRRLTK